MSNQPDKEVLDRVRASLDLPANISDDELYRLSKDSFTFAVCNLAAARDRAMLAIKETLPVWMKR